MSLGDIGRPTVDQFDGLRRLLLVPFVSSLADDEELTGLVERYWADAAEQVRNLEGRLGIAGQVYLEGSVVGGETELDALERANPAAAPFIRDTLERGATLRKTEEVEALLEAVDLQRCLMVAQASQKVVEQLSAWLVDARKRRYETIAKRIDETLPAQGVGVLIISQDHQIQFPADIRVFYIAPPVLSQIERWVRDRATIGVKPAPDQAGDAEGNGELLDS